jgi:hypothetical protein
MAEPVRYCCRASRFCTKSDRSPPPDTSHTVVPSVANQISIFVAALSGVRWS